MYAVVKVIENESVYLVLIPVKKALDSEESDEWMQAMTNKVKSILRSWLPRSGAPKMIRRRLVLRNKYGPEGPLERHKARIVAKGYLQQYVKNFHVTFIYESSRWHD